METRGTNRFDDETELKHEVLRRLDEDDESYREVSSQTFYVGGRRRNISPAQISRWKKQAANEEDGTTEGTTDGAVAAEAFKLFEEGATPSKVVIALRQPPDVISDLYYQWAELSKCLVVNAHLRNYIHSRTSYPVEDLAGLFVAIPKLVEDHEKLRAFRYSCGKCGGLIQASNEVWNWIVQKGYLAIWGHKQCPNVKQA